MMIPGEDFQSGVANELAVAKKLAGEAVVAAAETPQSHPLHLEMLCAMVQHQAETGIRVTLPENVFLQQLDIGCMEGFAGGPVLGLSHADIGV